MASSATKKGPQHNLGMMLVEKPRKKSRIGHVVKFFSLLITGFLLNMWLSVFLVLDPTKIRNGILSMLVSLMTFIILRPLQALKRAIPSGSSVAMYPILVISKNLAFILTIVLDNIIPTMFLFTSTFMCHDYLSTYASLAIQGTNLQQIIGFGTEKMLISSAIGGLVCLPRQKVKYWQDIVVVVSAMLFIAMFAVVRMFRSKSYAKILEDTLVNGLIPGSLFSVYAILGTCAVLYYSSTMLVDYDPAGWLCRYLRDKMPLLAPVIDPIYPRQAAPQQQAAQNPQQQANVKLPSAGIRLVVRCIRCLIVVAQYGIPLLLIGLISWYMLLPNITDMFFVFFLLLTRSKIPHHPAIEVPTAIGTFNILVVFKPIFLLLVQSASMKLYDALHDKRLKEHDKTREEKENLIKEKRRRENRNPNDPITYKEMREVSTVRGELWEFFWGAFVLRFVHPSFVIGGILIVLAVFSFDSVFFSISMMAVSFGVCCVVAPLLYLVGIILRYIYKEKSRARQVIAVIIGAGVAAGVLYCSYLFYFHYYEQILKYANEVVVTMLRELAKQPAYTQKVPFAESLRQTQVLNL